MIEPIFLDFAKEAILAPPLIFLLLQNRKLNDQMMLHVSKAAGKTIMSKGQALKVAKAMVKAASIDKINHIKYLIEKGNINLRVGETKSSIKEELIRISSIYINDLNTYNVEGRVILGDWVANNFPMEEFLEGVYEIVFSNKDILDKTTDIQTLMLRYQNEMWEDLSIYFKN